MVEITEPTEIKIPTGKYYSRMTLIPDHDRLYCKFGYNKKLIEFVKGMAGARYHGFDDVKPRKIWSIKNNRRNLFQIARLMGENPYELYDKDIDDGIARIKKHASKFPLREYQIEMSAHALVHRQCIYACEMGTGKTLAAFAVIETLISEGTIRPIPKDIWYVGPKAGVKAVNLELTKWNCSFIPRMITYERLVRIVHDGFDDVPKIVVFDESSKIKNATAKRSQAAMYLADLMRDMHGDDAFLIEMSGTPAPRTPVDWWHQTEVACPGFLLEGDANKFKKRLCKIEERESITGGVYPHIVTWWDDEKKCQHCGQYHKGDEDHPFVPSTNEVERLYKRMTGLVLVKFKKDCIDLPEKQYQEIQVTPSVEILRAARLISKKATSAIKALTLLRELSDGFQYYEKDIGDAECDECHGTGEVEEPVPIVPIDTQASAEAQLEGGFEMQTIVCPKCGGRGHLVKRERSVSAVSSPKDDELIAQLDAHEDVGRLIVWGGFTGTIDRIVGICHRYGWAVLRVDGRGYEATDTNGCIVSADDFLIAMDSSHPRYKELLEQYPRIVFVGHPQAGGMALTLTASPTEIFYSNCFSGEARMQAEDRAHRLGMDANRGLTIIDLIMLPSDKLVLDNLKKKKRLQNMTLGELQEAMEV